MKNYRPNAGIVVFRADGKVLLCVRNDCDDSGKNWQFPQGGIDQGETPLQAAVRELREETSVTSVEYAGALPEPVRYDFPAAVKQKNAARGIFNDGQEQYWHLFYFTGQDGEINLQTEEPEFKAYQWVDIAQALDRVVAFKYAVYEQVVKGFAPLIKQYLQSK